MNVRLATVREADALAKVINAAFVVEAFFKIGNRTSAEEIASLMKAGSEFLVIGAGPGGHEDIAACVHLKCSGDRAYLGMLSVDPARQRQGLGRRLVVAVETRARERGCRFVDMHIVNLRAELPAYYRALGYEETGTLPFSDPELSTQACYFMVMSKAL